MYPTNPRFQLGDEYRDIVALWSLYSAGMGVGHLPDAGGASDQSCWLIEAFGIMTAMERELNKQSRG